MEDSGILAKIINDYPDALSDRKRLQALLLDCFPQDKLKRNTLMMVFDDGIVAQMQQMKEIDKTTLNRFVKSIVQGYGIRMEHARNVVAAWAKALKLYQDLEHETAVSDYSKPEVEWVEAGDDNLYEYEETSRGVKITKFVDFDEPVIKIPNMIEGKKVLEIGNHAFKGCIGIEKVIISEGIEIIGNGAFLNCRGLKEIVLPNTLKRIGTTDSTGCPKILGSLTKYDGAFEYSGLESINIPDSVKVIGENTFTSCMALKKAILPDKLKEIKENTFCWCKDLEEVEMPEELAIIRMSAFAGCESLRSVILPEMVKSIEQGAFAGCKSLESIYIPDSVGEIGGGKNSVYTQTFGEIDERHKDFTILCNAGSYAMQYARAQQIKCARAQY
ncbi:MAG: leucine-rich repeat domain-containing protein [Clostridiales bacterium]|nr:leucine-rich repeat domain-containing protein [Clostridiales bacterium]